MKRWPNIFLALLVALLCSSASGASRLPLLQAIAPGNHTLTATANYAVGQYAATTSSSFSVQGTNTVTDYYDGAGYVTNRVYGSGKTQALTWDGLGRLTALVQRDSSGSGFNWTAIYDGLGRRLRTVNIPVVTNYVNSVLALTLDSYFDPQVEFQELAVAVNGQRTWKVLGPDVNGGYGGLNGVGGLEATLVEAGSQTTPVLNDYAGNVLATISGSVANWNPVRVGGYGPLLGYQAQNLTVSTPLAETLVWRSRRIDPSGYFNLGARYYDPLAGRFLSPDPMGHASSMDLYSFCGGDPVNRFDANGRFAAGMLNGAAQYGGELYASMGNAIDSVLYMGFSDAYNAVNKPKNEVDGRYAYNYANGSDAYQMGHQVGYTAAET